METAQVPVASFNHVALVKCPEAQEKENLYNGQKVKLNPRNRFSLKGREASKIKTMEN